MGGTKEFVTAAGIHIGNVQSLPTLTAPASDCALFFGGDKGQGLWSQFLGQGQCMLIELSHCIESWMQQTTVTRRKLSWVHGSYITF
jgi:hypothetical protein